MQRDTHVTHVMTAARTFTSAALPDATLSFTASLGRSQHQRWRSAWYTRSAHVEANGLAQHSRSNRDMGEIRSSTVEMTKLKVTQQAGNIDIQVALPGSVETTRPLSKA